MHCHGSKPEHVTMNFEQLLSQMKTMYDHRPSKLGLRKEFEQRKWHSNEAFTEYFHDKVVLANRVSVDEDELMDYIIDGISDVQLRNQARMHCFKSKTMLLEAFEKIPAPYSTKFRNNRYEKPKGEDKTNKSPLTEKDAKEKDAKEKDSFRMSMECYNCNGKGHMSRECKKPKRSVDTCFQCGETGHRANSCSNQNNKENDMKSDQIANVESQQFEEDGNFKYITVRINERDKRIQLVVDTLLDTGSPISFIKQAVIPDGFVSKTNINQDTFRGINNTVLKIVGEVNVTLEVDDIVQKDIFLRVVPNNTVRYSTVLVWVAMF